MFTEIDEMIEMIAQVTGKKALVIWEFYENYGDTRDIYPGDAIPDDYLNRFPDTVICSLYKYLNN